MMFWEATRDLPLVSALEHQGSVRSAAFSPNGTYVVTVRDPAPPVNGYTSDEKTARVWDAATGKQLAALEHQDPVLSAAFSADSTRVVTVSDTTARVWGAATGKQLATLEHHDWVSSAA